MRETREMSRERGSEREGRHEYSVFVSNLPWNLDRYGLRGIFQRAGRVSDSFIPFKGPHWNGRRFGFVRFWKESDAINSINLFNKVRIRGMVIYVSMARPKRRILGRDKLHRSASGFKKKESAAAKKAKVWMKKADNFQKDKVTTVRVSQESQPYKLGLKGEINHDFEEWLSRSLVCTTDVPRDLATLASAIVDGYGQCSKICAISSFKFLLTFSTVELMEEVLLKHEELKTWFVDIRRWSTGDFCETRKVWIEVYGVPPHGWNWENFKSIAEIWGQFISLGKSILHTESFEAMRVLIETNSFHRIEQDLILYLDYEGFRVQIMEAGSGTYYVHNHHHVHKSNMMNEDSNDEVPGFEDVNDEVDSGSDMARNNLKLVGHVSKEMEKEVIEESSCNKGNLNSNLDKDCEQTERVNERITSSGSRPDSRMKTVSAAGISKCTQPPFLLEIGLSTQKPKTMQQLSSGGRESSGLIRTLENDSEFKVGDLRDNQLISDAPPGFEHWSSKHVSTSPRPAPNSQEIVDEVQKQQSSNSLRYPPGFEPTHHISEQSVKNSNPTVAEVNTKMKKSSGQQRCIRKKQIHCLGRRVTRSQVKKCNELSKRRMGMRNRDGLGSEGEEESPFESESVKTTESMRNLAEESLKVGELLGVKVVANKENAIKRITQSLKNARVPKTIHRTN